MTSKETSAGRRATLLDWLARINSQVAGWAAQASWGRLVLLFIVVMIAAGILGDLLQLKHEKIRVPVAVVQKKGKDSGRITIDEQGIRIEGTQGSKRLEIPARPGGSQGAASGSAGPQPEANPDPDPDPDIDDEPRLVARRIVTFRGVLGDIGAALLVLLFAYLVAAKIVVRKVAQADAKAQKAMDTAEREAVERQLVQAKLQVLQAQVEPHFLFNTLAAVDYLIETDPKRASQMQKQLITYLRGALPQMRQESSTLGREVRLARSYLELIRMRIEERLQVEVNLPEGLESAEFPPMMLQSLVENAIKHGIEPKPEGGKVSVTAKVANGLLWVEVHDSGVGFVGSLEQIDAPRQPGAGGIGLQNIRERLAMLYGGKARFTLMSDDSTGTVVRIGVPYKVGVEAAGEAEGEPEGKPA